MDELRNLNRNIKDLVDGLRAQFEKLAGSIATHVNDAMTDEMALVKDTVTDGLDAVKTGAMTVYGFFAKSFDFEKDMMKQTKQQTGIMKETLRPSYDELSDISSHIKKQTALMEGTGDILRKEHIEKRKIIKKGPKGIWDYLMDILGVPFFLAGAIIGTLVGVIVAPFRAMYALFEGLKFFDILGGILKLIPGVSKLFSLFGRFFTWIWEIVLSIEKIPFLGKLLSAGARGFMLGLNKLFWPIQIIMSIFDFVEGWQKTKGSIWDKALGGIKRAIMKFIEFPVMLLEKAFNWVAKKFGLAGVEEGTFMKGIDNAFDFVTKKLIPMLWDWLLEGLKVMWKGIKDAFKYVSDNDFDFVKIAKNLLTEMFEAITKWISEKWKDTLDILPNFLKMDNNPKTSSMKELDDLRRKIVQDFGNTGRAEVDKVDKNYKDDAARSAALLKAIDTLNNNIKNGTSNNTLINAGGPGAGASMVMPSSNGPEKIAGINSSFSGLNLHLH